MRKFVSYMFSSQVPAFIPGAKSFNQQFNSLPLSGRVAIIAISGVGGYIVANANSTIKGW